MYEMARKKNFRQCTYIYNEGNESVISFTFIAQANKPQAVPITPFLKGGGVSMQ